MNKAAKDLQPGDRWIERNDIVTLCEVLPHRSQDPLSICRLEVHGELRGFHMLVLYTDNRRQTLPAEAKP